jgi:hypothetical protein
LVKNRRVDTGRDDMTAEQALRYAFWSSSGKLVCLYMQTAVSKLN